jgi:hypothetical protein
MTTTNRYQNGKIYAIRSHLTEQIYIGSTCEARLSKRMVQHRSSYRIFLRDGGKSTTSRIILENGDAYIELIENFPCNNKDELTRREGFHIRNTNCVNKVIPFRTRDEYYQDNIEKIRIYKKNYNIFNYESIKQRKKQYRIDNKDLIKINQKQYRIDNKELIKTRTSRRIQCDYCNNTFMWCKRTRHIRSKNHINNYKAAYLECFGEVFDGIITNEDY